MTARDLGAVLARMLAILSALQASRYLMVLPGFAMGLSAGGESTRWAWGMLGASVAIIAALFFGALLLWRNADRFWTGGGTLPQLIDATLLHRVAMGGLGMYLTLTAAPALIQTVVALALPETDLGKFALEQYSIWDAISTGVQVVAGLALWYYNRQRPPEPRRLPDEAV